MDHGYEDQNSRQNVPQNQSVGNVQTIEWAGGSQDANVTLHGLGRDAPAGLDRIFKIRVGIVVVVDVDNLKESCFKNTDLKLMTLNSFTYLNPEMGSNKEFGQSV